MIIPFKYTLFLKEFLACNDYSGLFSKTKKGSRASFWCTFFALFFHKNFPYLILYQWTKFQCHTLFLSLEIKTVDDIMNLKVFLGSTSEAMADGGKNKGSLKKVYLCSFHMCWSLFLSNLKKIVTMNALLMT